MRQPLAVSTVTLHESNGLIACCRRRLRSSSRSTLFWHTLQSCAASAQPRTFFLGLEAIVELYIEKEDYEEEEEEEA